MPLVPMKDESTGTEPATTAPESTFDRGSLSDRFKAKAGFDTAKEDNSEDTNVSIEETTEEPTPEVEEDESKVEETETVSEETEETESSETTDEPEFSNEAITDFLSKQKFEVKADGVTHELAMDKILEMASAGMNFTKKSMNLARDQKFMEKLKGDPIALAEYMNRIGGDTSLLEKKEEPVEFEIPDPPDFYDDDEKAKWTETYKSNFEKQITMHKVDAEKIDRLTHYINKHQDQQVAVQTKSEFDATRKKWKKDTGVDIPEAAFDAVAMFMEKGLQKYGVDERGELIYTMEHAFHNIEETANITPSDQKQFDEKAETARIRKEVEKEYRESVAERDGKHKVVTSQGKGSLGEKKVTSIQEAKEKWKRKISGG